MPNIQQSNAPIHCPCSERCIATMHLVIVMTPTPFTTRTVCEVDVCSKALDEITRTLRLLPSLHWQADKLVPRAIPMPQAKPDDRTRPVALALDHASELTSPFNVAQRFEAHNALRRSDDELLALIAKQATAEPAEPPVEAIDEEVSGVHDTGLPTPLPLVDDPTTNAIADRPLPSLAHRVFVLKRLVEAFDDFAGIRTGDVSQDRKVSFDEDLAKLGARHQTMTMRSTEGSYETLLNANVFINKGSVLLHVFRFETFAAFLQNLDHSNFVTLTSYLEQLDEKLHAGAFKFLRLVACEVAQRADAIARGTCPPLKTAYFEFV